MAPEPPAPGAIDGAGGGGYGGLDEYGDSDRNGGHGGYGAYGEYGGSDDYRGSGESSGYGGYGGSGIYDGYGTSEVDYGEPEFPALPDIRPPWASDPSTDPLSGATGVIGAATSPIEATPASQLPGLPDLMGPTTGGYGTLGHGSDPLTTGSNRVGAPALFADPLGSPDIQDTPPPGYGPAPATGYLAPITPATPALVPAPDPTPMPVPTALPAWHGRSARSDQPDHRPGWAEQPARVEPVGRVHQVEQNEPIEPSTDTDSDPMARLAAYNDLDDRLDDRSGARGARRQRRRREVGIPAWAGIAVSVVGTTAFILLDVILTRSIGLLFGLCFVLTAFGLAAGIRRSEIFTAGVLPPLAAIGAFTVVGLLMPGRIGASSFVEAVLGGLSTSAWFLLAASAVALGTIAFRVAFAKDP